MVMEISENLSRGVNVFHVERFLERVQGVSTFTRSIVYFLFKILLKKALKDAFCFLAKPVFLFCLPFVLGLGSDLVLELQCRKSKRVISWLEQISLQTAWIFTGT